MNLKRSTKSKALQPAMPDLMSMEDTHDNIRQVLHEIYSKHRQRHRENPDSKQMCCMWSTEDPPDIIEGTDPLCDLEAAFHIYIDDDDALELYDMTLDEAARKIMQIKEKKC